MTALDLMNMDIIKVIINNIILQQANIIIIINIMIRKAGIFNFLSYRGYMIIIY